MNSLKDFPYSRALVVGMAKSGRAAAMILQKNGVETTVNDRNAVESSPEAQEMKAEGITFVTGGHPLGLLDEAEVVVKNPGIPYENELIAEAVQREIPVLTEVELVSYLHNGPVIGITGSNGKTTTTTLVHRMLEEDGKAVRVAGNIGEVACEVAEHTEDGEIMVIELSSFQLLGTRVFHPDVSVWLNLFDSHLDYHKTSANYVAAKANIVKNQTSADWFIYNAEDTIVSQYKEKTSAKSIPFSSNGANEGAWADDRYLYFEEEIVAEKEKIVLAGEHNVQNALAAIAACRYFDVSTEAIQAVLYHFKGVSHRLEYVAQKEGRFFYNDSKATNIRATSHALEAFSHPVVLLAGGLDRGNEFDELTPYLSSVKQFVLFGETARKLEDLSRELGIPSVKVESMEEAVNEAYRLSGEEDVILLSPACASWDQYRTFEERGNKFIEAVHKL